MADVKTDIIVTGATGFTGRLVVKYLTSHRERKRFTFGIAGRDYNKLKALSTELGLDADIPHLSFNTSDEKQVVDVVKKARVIINCIGPFWLYSSPIVIACAQQGVHYVDISGEPFWAKELIEKYDFIAFKNKAIIVPMSGFESVPNDLAVYRSVQALQRKFGPEALIGSSISSIRDQGGHGGVSGGTIETFLSFFDSYPPSKRADALDPFIISPFRGIKVPPRLVYSQPVTNTIGGVFPLSIVNTQVINRTFGLLEKNHAQSKSSTAIKYGPNFQYEEFAVAESKLSGLITSVVISVVLIALEWLYPLRWLIRKYGPQPGTGPSDSAITTVIITNVSSLAEPRSGHAKTTVRMYGMGYAITAAACVESALCALLDHEKLSDTAKQGGFLTPATAFGSILVNRLQETSEFSFETALVST